MKNLKTFGVSLTLTLCLLMLEGSFQKAYGQPGGGNPCPGGQPCDPEAPITGIEWLIISGGFLGGIFVRRKFSTKDS
jgi:hypothetical protein